jgi:LmbE family N-acetylglucosaminyl deacetylase
MTLFDGRKPVVLAAVAHPDDIEFACAGTLLLLQEAGWTVHLWNLANGCQGTERHSREEIIQIRGEEARAAALLISAEYHPPLFDDLAIFYDASSLARTAAVLREIQPDLILTHNPQDYMEDHQNVCRLIVTGAFSRQMKNFITEPPLPPSRRPVRLYHAMPHGLRDGLGVPVRPHAFVDIGGMLPVKRRMLACHRSQQEWLDASQKMGAYLDEMEQLAAELGKISGKFAFAEGFLRHSHLGFCPADYDPLSHFLGNHYLINNNL